MPRISASCRPSPEGRGFSLLELLVVMALLALVSGMVLPTIGRQLDASRRRGVDAQLHEVLNALPLRARAAQEPQTWGPAELRAELEDAPADTQLRLSEPLRYDARGLATGGRVELLLDGKVVQQWAVQANSGLAERQAAR